MTSNSDMDDALLFADLWRVLALVFSPPTTESLAQVRSVCRDLASCPRVKGLPVRVGLEELAGWLDPEQAVAMEHEYNALFLTEALVPAYEGCYQRMERGAVVGDTAGFYRAFGLELQEHTGPSDSLWNELAFMAWLSVKEAYALGQAREEERSVTRRAATDFLGDHLGRWAGIFTQRVLGVSGHPLYTTAAHLLLAAVSVAVDALEVGPIDALGEYAGAPEPDALSCPMACAEPS